MNDANFYKTIHLNRFQVFNTSEGFMVYDHDCDEYLYDDKNNNCFSGIKSAMQLLNDAIQTIKEHIEVTQ